MAFQQGLSGLNAASRNLDVIGNNIANANTVGMKSSRAEFAEVYAASAGTTGSTGLGSSVAAVTQQFNQGSISVTGNNLDVAINGAGFFQLKQPDDTTAYTRAGNFKLNNQGGLVTNEGARVMGTMIENGVPLPGPVPLSLPSGKLVAAKPTAEVTAILNLPAQEPEAATQVPPTPRSTFGTSVNVYDAQGVSRPLNVYFVKDAAANTWQVFDELDTTTPPVTATALGTVAFDSSGQLVSTTPDPLTAQVDVSPTNPNAATPPTIAVNIVLTGSTQFGSKFGVTELQQDGYAEGKLTSFNIANDGQVMASYSNGVTRAEAEIGLVNFRNAQGLAPGGGSIWTATSESGEPVAGKPGAGNLGLLRSGALEDSNVDLTSELVNMMVAQRAYQANAQTIKTQDQVLSSLLNMR
jgi:flagellar hook protein FlgE